MKKHWRLLLLLAAFVACVGGYVAWLGRPRPGVTLHNVERIDACSTDVELTALLGEPTEVVWREDGSYEKTWVDDPVVRNIAVSIIFTRDGHRAVIEMHAHTSPPAEDLLGRWHRWLFGR
jgi:hypothetical protein